VAGTWRILVIDDDRYFRQALASALERWATVRTVDTVDGAYRLLETWNPHAIVLDPVLQSGDGIALVAACVRRENLHVFCPLTRHVSCWRSPLHSVVIVPRHGSIAALARHITDCLRERAASRPSGETVGRQCGEKLSLTAGGQVPRERGY